MSIGAIAAVVGGLGITAAVIFQLVRNHPPTWRLLLFLVVAVPLYGIGADYSVIKASGSPEKWDLDIRRLQSELKKTQETTEKLIAENDALRQDVKLATVSLATLNETTKAQSEYAKWFGHEGLKIVRIPYKGLKIGEIPKGGAEYFYAFQAKTTITRRNWTHLPNNRQLSDHPLYRDGNHLTPAAPAGSV